MTAKLLLSNAFYRSRSVVANAQRCVNLYPEANPKDAPFPMTLYPTPGLVTRAQGPKGAVRCEYQATTGACYAVISSNVYFVSMDFGLQLLGSIPQNTNPCYMADNGIVLVLVDGSSSGWCIKLSDNTFGTISSNNFYGADRVDCLDTYFLLNRPATNQWYISLSTVDFTMLTAGSAFDALDIAAKTGSTDAIQSVVAVHREVWLIGRLASEVWYNNGAADFTFQAYPGAYIDHGCVARYSISVSDVFIFWLAQDRQGKGVVVKGGEYRVERISTHAIEQEINGYAKIDDAIGYTYQQEGHLFYVLTFPSASKTWVFDESTELWHERAWINTDGTLTRHRSNCHAMFYGKNIVGDFENGKLYEYSLSIYNDDGVQVPRIKSLQHILTNQNRISYSWLRVNVETGNEEEIENIETETRYLAAGPSDPLLTEEGFWIAVTQDAPVAPRMCLRYSDDGGRTYSNRRMQSLGRRGQYLTSVLFTRLGMGRDRVFEFSWSTSVKTAVSGLFFEPEESET